MTWPTSTASLLSLPKLPNSELHSRSAESQSGQDSEGEQEEERITGLEISKTGYFIAITTERGIYIYRPKPLCPVAVFIRSKHSLDTHGNNCTLSIRPDGQIIAVGTTLGSILTFQVSSQGSPNEVCTYGESLSTSSGGGPKHPLAYPGPGEAIGVREIKLKFRMLIKVDSGIAHILSLDDYLLVVTRSPAAIQFVRWSAEAGSLHQERTTTILLSQLKWLSTTDSVITSITRSRAMMFFSITTSCGAVYSATLEDRRGTSTVDNNHNNNEEIPKQPQLYGYCIHRPSQDIKKKQKNDFATITSINARFSLVAVGCKNGIIYLYNILDYVGNTQLIKTIDSPSISAGNIQTMKWSSDGNCLFVGYDNGVVFYSVYGMINASSFIVSKEKSSREHWLRGTRDVAWSMSGDCIFMIPNNGIQVWVLNVLKWNASASFTPENLNRPVLYDNNSILLYRGHEQSDITTIDRDALLWLSVSIPASYIAENWPIRYVSCSPDGRYVALAGVRGLTHYSLYSGRWKLFPEEYMDREFTVRGGIVWYENFIIIAVDTEYSTHEIRVYNRELGLDSQNVVLSLDITSAVLKLCTINDLLLIYTHSNRLLFYRISEENQKLTLELESNVSFKGILHSPSRVRALSCVATYSDGRPILNSTNIGIFLLVDGMLVLLLPSNSDSSDNNMNNMKNDNTNNDKNNENDEFFYRKIVLHEHVEFYMYSQGTNGIESMLWAFDGEQLLAWTASNLLETKVAVADVIKSPTLIPVESYPLSLLVDKGIVIGLESDIFFPIDRSFTYFKHWSTTELFIPWLIETYLRRDQISDALTLANEYSHLNYFGHILERLLSRVLEYENNSDQNQIRLLTNTIDLVCQFPQQLDVILGSTRKTEVKYWKRLFDIIGSPQELFEKCIKIGQLKTAAGYLLVLHTLENYDLSSQNTARLLDLAYSDGDLELCKELSRFLTAIDPSGETLRSTLKSINISIDV